jgi:hypothetical protein
MFSFLVSIRNPRYHHCRKKLNIEPYILKLFFIKTTESFEIKLVCNVPCTVLYKICVACVDPKFKMATKDGYNFT